MLAVADADLDGQELGREGGGALGLPLTGAACRIPGRSATAGRAGAFGGRLSARALTLLALAAAAAGGRR